MPAIGWKVGGKEYSYEEAFQIARKEGTFHDFPPAALRAMERHRVDGDWLSPSGAAGCPRQRILVRHINYHVDPEKEWVPGVGTAVHNWLQDNDDEHHEALLSTTLSVPLRDGRVVPFELRGSPDAYDPEQRRVYDYKTVKTWNGRAYPYDTHVLQINLYAYLFERNGMPVEDLIIWYIKQGGKDVRREAVKVPLWDMEEVENIAIEAAEPLAWYADNGEIPHNVYDPQWLPCMFCPVIKECKAIR